jgi:predicted aldo/keto reductase-like oxidoreductase
MKRRSFLKTVGAATAGAALVPERMLAAAAASPGDMPRRTLGRTGFQVSVAGFSGFALVHGTQEEATAAVHGALDRGLNYYDVAPAYGDGECENKLGVALQGLDRGSYFLACKTKKRDAAGLREELERSLQRLKTDHFDVYQLHHLVKPEDVKTALGPGGAVEEALKARKEGKIRALGFSAHTTKAAVQALNGFAFDTVMFPINYVEYFTRGFGKEVLALAREKGAAVLSIKTINAGAWPPGVERSRKWWYRPLEDQIDIDRAYRWTLSLPGVVLGFPPAWLDLQEKAITAALALREASAADAQILERMAYDCGSIFKREEDSVAMGREPESCYPHHPHDRPPSAWA